MNYNNFDDLSLDDLYLRLKELSEKILAQENLKKNPQYVPPVFSRCKSDNIFNENKADDEIAKNITQSLHDPAEKNTRLTESPIIPLTEKLSAFKAQIDTVLPQKNALPAENKISQTVLDDDDDILKNLEKLKQLIKELE